MLFHHFIFIQWMDSISKRKLPISGENYFCIVFFFSFFLYWTHWLMQGCVCVCERVFSITLPSRVTWYRMIQHMPQALSGKLFLSLALCRHFCLLIDKMYVLVLYSKPIKIDFAVPLIMFTETDCSWQCKIFIFHFIHSEKSYKYIDWNDKGQQHFLRSIGNDVITK